MDADDSGKLKLWEMRKFLEGPVSFNGDIDLVFESLDMNSSGSLSENEVTWLDSWDVLYDKSLYEESDPLAAPPMLSS